MRTSTSTSTGELVKQWRRTRGMTQIELAVRAETSARNLSFIETGRTKPSESLLERICKTLAIPGRERHVLMRSAGYGRTYEPFDLAAPESSSLAQALETMIQAIDPFPVVVVDRTFRHISSNAGMRRFIAYILDDAERFARERPNMLEALLSDDWARPYFVNWREIGPKAIHRIYRDAMMEDLDGELWSVYEHLLAIPGIPEEWRTPPVMDPDPLVRFHFVKDGRELNFDSVITTMGTPADVWLQGIRMRYFLPADAATHDFVHELAHDMP